LVSLSAKTEAQGERFDKYNVLMQIYLEACGQQKEEFMAQLNVINKLEQTALLCAKTNNFQERTKIVYETLQKVGFSRYFRLPNNPAFLAKGFLSDQCKSMKSATAPLWLVLDNADRFGSPAAVIFKVGDDLRQDTLTLQMIKIMDQMWKKEGLDLHMSAYSCISTGPKMGIIEVVPDSITIAKIAKDHSGATATFKKTPLKEWLQLHNPNPNDYETAVNNFTLSCAGYCVASYVLGLADRHNDNIMVTKTGQLFHIDFANFLGHVMTFGIYKRETAPFVFTPDFAHLMGGEDSARYAFFTELCGHAFNIVRQNAHIILGLFSLMLTAKLPQLKSEEDLEYVKEALHLRLSEEEARATFAKLIEKSLHTKNTQINFFIHTVVNPD
jgi:phosphatidylinositol kinase/protein kinase (PI-3  family)